MVGGAITAPPAATPEPNMRPFGCTQAILSHSSGSSVSIAFHSRKYPTDVIAQAQSVLEGWKQFDPALPAIDALEAQLTSLRNQRDDVLNSLWDSTKRVRSAVKGIYGNDSSEYEMVGGTRLSERK